MSSCNWRLLAIMLLVSWPGLGSAGCAENDGGGKVAAAHPKLPVGVAWQPGNRHCPTTVLEERPEGYGLKLEFALEEDELHSIEEVRVLGPHPDFVLLQGRKPEGGVVGREQVFEIPKTTQVEQMDHLLVVVRCKQHGA